MSDGAAVKLVEKWNVYKWDAAVVGETPPDPTTIDASKHPGCVEIWEIVDGQAATCIYRRD